MKRNKEEMVMTLPVYQSQRTILKEELYFAQLVGSSVDEIISNTFHYNDK
jgi:hypothetical protein